MASYVLRGINWSRWRQAVEEKTLNEDGACEPLLMADVFLDMKTSGNSLSVYFVSDTQDQILPVAVGLAAGKQRLDRFDYVLFRQELLDQLKIRYRHSDGDGKHKEANKVHVDLEGLTFYQLTELILYICCDEATQLRRVEKPILGQGIIKAIRDGHVSQNDIEEKVHSESMKYLTK